MERTDLDPGEVERLRNLLDAEGGTGDAIDAGANDADEGEDSP